MAKSTRKSFTAAAKRIERLHQRMGSKTIPSGLRIIGEELRTDMVASRPGKGVPRDTSVLANSHRVTGPKHNEVEISAGGAAAPYALEQHENLSYGHNLGEARWMVRAIDRWKPNGASARKAIDEMLSAVDDLAIR